MKRRTAIKLGALAGLGWVVTPPARGQTDEHQPRWKPKVLAYLKGLARDDGGYGWADQEHGHLTPTFGVIASYRALGESVPDKDRVAAFVRSHHPKELKKLEQRHGIFEYQQIQALTWLGVDTSEFREVLGPWVKPWAFMKRYEQDGNPVFQSEASVLTSRKLLGLPVGDSTPDLVTYVDERRRANGSFNNTPASDGSDGHVMNTWWGLKALETLGRAQENREAAIAWLQACQLPEGGFTWQPNAEFANLPDIAYVWSAVRALALLEAETRHRLKCVTFIGKLWNDDGGFGDKPGWESNPMATFRALEALHILDAGLTFDFLAQPVPKRRRALSPDLKIYSAQVEAHGAGSPQEAVDLAGALGIHMWGAKNAKPGWIERCQEIADTRKVPVTFFVSDEEYGTWVRVPGLGTYSHTSDIIAPAGVDFGKPLSDQGVVTWPEFRHRRFDALRAAGGRLVWQFGENEELVRFYLDESIRRGGYAAISTFHFGNPDFTNSEPFLKAYRGQVPYIGLQDAHGPEPWWFADMTEGFRTLFLAKEPTWEAWLDALRENRVMSVRHDAVSGGKTWRHSGSDEVLEFVMARETEWRWWDNPGIQRPVVSLVAVRPEEQFEVGRPERGVNLRVRCQWINTTQGQPKEEVAQFLSLSVDGKLASPRLVETKGQRGLTDHYHLFEMPDIAPGMHTATVTVRKVASGKEESRTLKFEA